MFTITSSTNEIKITGLFPEVMPRYNLPQGISGLDYSSGNLYIYGTMFPTKEADR